MKARCLGAVLGLARREGAVSYLANLVGFMVRLGIVHKEEEVEKLDMMDWMIHDGLKEQWEKAAEKKRC